MRITMTQNKRDFIDKIGNPNMSFYNRLDNKNTHSFVKRVYCQKCLTTHEENIHREETK